MAYNTVRVFSTLRRRSLFPKVCKNTFVVLVISLLVLLGCMAFHVPEGLSAPGIDLYIENHGGGDSPDMSYDRDPVTHRITKIIVAVHNIGSSSCPSGGKVHFYYTFDYPDWQECTGSPVDMPNLIPAGGYGTFSLSWTPPTVTRKTVCIRVKAVVPVGYTDDNPNNNAAFENVDVGGIYAGGTQQRYFSLKNIELGSIDVTLTVDVNPIEWTAVLDLYSFPLLADAVQLVTLTINSPTTADVGEIGTVDVTVYKDGELWTHYIYTYTVLSKRVGGFAIPVDKSGLLAPYIGLVSTIIIAAVVATVYVRRVRPKKEKQ